MELNEKQQILASGQKLYGESPDDVSHIEYAIGLAIDSIEHFYDSAAIGTLIEVGKDERGLFVSFPNNLDRNVVDE